MQVVVASFLCRVLVMIARLRSYNDFARKKVNGQLKSETHLPSTSVEGSVACFIGPQSWKELIRLNIASKTGCTTSKRAG